MQEQLINVYVSTRAGSHVFPATRRASFWAHHTSLDAIRIVGRKRRSKQHCATHNDETISPVWGCSERLTIYGV